MNSAKGKDEPPEAFAVTGEEASSAVSGLREATDPMPLSEGRLGTNPMTRKRKSRPAKKKHSARDESKPSHPLSAYNFFFRDERVRFLQEPKKDLEPGENRFTSMGKEIARRWKSLQSDDAQKYHKMAASDLVRYRKELEEYQSKKEATQKVLGDTRSSEGALKAKPAPQLHSEQDGTRGLISGYRESSHGLGDPLPPHYDTISSSGYGALSNALGHRDLATETALAQLFGQDASAASASRSIFEHSGRSATDRTTLEHQLLSQYPLLASALARTGLDRDYSTPLGGWDATSVLRDVPVQSSSFAEQILMGNLMGRTGAESFNTGAIPWNNSLLNLPSANTDPAVQQQRAQEQHDLLQLLSGSTSRSTSSLLDRSSNPLGLPSQSFLSAASSTSQTSSERDFLASNDALALQRLLLLRHQQERDLQAAMAARNANDDFLLRRLLGAVRDGSDGQNSAGPGPRSRQPDRNNGGGTEASGGS